ncbi:MAG TPA: head GIN domain-containing protein [Flavobacterium sp.]
MKNIVLLIAMITCGISSAQMTKNLGDFDRVSVFDRISVELIPSGENKIEVTGKRSNEVEVVNRNGELKIRMKLEKLLDGEDIQAKIYFSSITAIEANEGSFISSARTFSQTSIDLNAKEGAQIKIDLNVSKANVRAVTGGILKLTGKATNMDAVLGTGGILEAKDLLTTQSKVNIKAGGEAEVNASELVDADIKAGGNVRIYGSPKQINKNTALGGTITEER